MGFIIWPNLFVVAVPYLIFLWILYALAQYDTGRIPILHYFTRPSVSFYNHTEATDPWLVEAVEELRGDRPMMLDPALLGKKPILLRVAEEYLKREQRKMKEQPSAGSPKEMSEDLGDYETEADQTDDFLRHELKVRRAMFHASEMAARASYRPVAYRRLFQEPSSRYRHRFPVLKDKYSRGKPTAATVLHSVANDDFPKEFAETNRAEFKSRPPPKKDPIYDDC